MSNYDMSGQEVSQERLRGCVNAFIYPGAIPAQDAEQSVPDCFEKVVALHSNRLAIKTARHALTYDALNKAANRVARVVLEKSHDSDLPVVVVFDHDAPIVVAILAVLKAGKTCVVLDPSYPEQRAAHIIEDSQAKLILVDSQSGRLARKFSGPEHLIFNIDEIDSNASAENLGLCISPDAFAFILYTSGSTGQPKGVIQNHRNVIHNALRYATGCRIGPQDRVTLLASLGTGQGTPTAFSALLSGAALYPLQVKKEGVSDLARWLRTEEITIYISTPSLFRSLVATLTGQEEFSKLRTIRLGAEQIRKSDIELYKRYFSEKCLLALFLSATEVGNLCQYFVDKEAEIPGDIIPAGRPVDGIDILLLDDTGKEVGPNEIGEIVIKSRFISPGYWRNPELTKAVFLPDGDKRIYRTGDLGRLLPNGDLEHLGRKDFQIKIRGYRVEVAEIESALLQLDQVKEAIVVAVKSRNGDTELAAYVVPNGRPDPRPREIRSLLKEKLPDYMIPASFTMLEALPLNPTGKVDRQALPAPAKDTERNAEFVAPYETIEHQLAEIWEEFLGVHPIGLRDSFFDLGGHSLLAAQMMHRVEQVCGQKLSLATLLAGPTIEHLAKALIEQRVKENDSLLVQVQAGGVKQPLFFMHGDLAGGGFYCLNLARGLGEDRPFYALTPHGVDGGPIPPTIEEIAASFIEMIRTVQLKGPYFLGGLCKGGITAFEMARQLERQGEKVELLIIVGSTGWNAHFRLLHVLVSAIGFFSRVTPGERARLFLASRDLCRYLRLRLKEVAQFSPGQKISWAWRVTKKTARRVTRRTVIEPQHLVVDLMGPQYSKPLNQSLSEFYLSSPYQIQLGGYVPGRYSGRVEFFWANDEPARHPLTPALLWKQLADSTLGWGRVAKRLRVHILPGVTNTSITTDVKVLAEQMKACLEEVQASKRGRSRFRPDSNAVFSK